MQEDIYLLLDRVLEKIKKWIEQHLINYSVSTAVKWHPIRNDTGWATHAFEEGIYKENEVQYLAGHKSLASTQIYLNPNIVKMKEKANQQ